MCLFFFISNPFHYDQYLALFVFVFLKLSTSDSIVVKLVIHFLTVPKWVLIHPLILRNNVVNCSCIWILTTFQLHATAHSAFNYLYRD